MQANPGASAADLFPKAAAANRNVFYTDGGAQRSLSEVLDLFRQKMGQAVAQGGDMPAAAFAAVRPGLRGRCSSRPAPMGPLGARIHGHGLEPFRKAAARWWIPCATPSAVRAHRPMRCRITSAPPTPSWGPSACDRQILLKAAALALPIGILTIILLMIMPIPAMVLDVFFVLNIALSVAILMAAMNAAEAARFLVLPLGPAVRDPAAPGAQRRLDQGRAGPRA